MLAAVVLLIGGPVAWSYRPLNSVERAVVGRWWDRDYRGMIELGADRRFQANVSSARLSLREGSWRASGTSIDLSEDRPDLIRGSLPWTMRLRSYLSSFSTPPTQLRLDGPDRLWLADEDFDRLHDVD